MTKEESGGETAEDITKRYEEELAKLNSTQKSSYIRMASLTFLVLIVVNTVLELVPYTLSNLPYLLFGLIFVYFLYKKDTTPSKMALDHYEIYRSGKLATGTITAVNKEKRRAEIGNNIYHISYVFETNKGKKHTQIADALERTALKKELSPGRVIQVFYLPRYPNLNYPLTDSPEDYAWIPQQAISEFKAQKQISR